MLGPSRPSDADGGLGVGAAGVVEALVAAVAELGGIQPAAPAGRELEDHVS